MNLLSTRLRALFTLVLGSAFISLAAALPVAPFNICDSEQCFCAADVDNRPSLIDTTPYVTSCGVSFGVAKNGCCKLDLPEPICEEPLPCIFAFNYCAVATPGTILAWVCRNPGQTTDEAIAAGQFVIEGAQTNVMTTARLQCGQGLICELWAYNPGLTPTTVLLDSFDFKCADCPG